MFAEVLFPGWLVSILVSYIFSYRRERVYTTGGDYPTLYM